MKIIMRKSDFNNWLVLFWTFGGILLPEKIPTPVSIAWVSVTAVLCIFIYRSVICPQVIFTIFMVLYVVSYPMKLVMLGDSSTSYFNDVETTVLAGQFLILGFFSAAILPKPIQMRAKLNVVKNRLEIIFRNPSAIGRAILICLAVIIASLMLLKIQGNVGTEASSKHQLSTSGFLVMIVFFALPVFFFLIFSSRHELTKRNWLVSSMIFVTLFFVYFSYTGERDVLVRAVLIVYIIGIVNGFLGKSSAVAILIAGVFSEPVLALIKAFAVIGIQDYSVSAASIFSGEFSSQGRNFLWAVQREQVVSEIYADTLWKDFLRFLYINDASSTSLFGREVIGRSGGAGLGFSILAQFYFSGGYPLIFALGYLMYLILYIFEPQRSSLVSAFLYASVIFGLAYSLRADLANLLGQVFKVSLMPILLVIFLLYIGRKLQWAGSFAKHDKPPTAHR